MSDDIFNPFRCINESSVSPNARWWRTGFTTKLKDAFFIFTGSCNIFGEWIRDYEDFFDPNRTTIHFGLLDWATLSIPLMVEAAAIVAWGSKNPLIKFGVGFFVGLVAIPLAIVRVLIAGILAFNPLSLIIIGALHVVSQATGGWKLKEKVNFARVVFRNDTKQDEAVDDLIDIEKMAIQYQENGVCEEEEPFFSLPKFVKGDKGEILGLEVVANGLPSRNGGVFYLPIFSNQLNDSRVEGVHASLKLNFHRVTEGMEGYISEFGNLVAIADNKEFQGNCKDCREVLNLLAPPPVDSLKPV